MQTAPPRVQQRHDLIAERDGERCVWCLTDSEPLCCTRVVRRVRGGPKDYRNMVLSCDRCNRMRGISGAGKFYRNCLRMQQTPDIEALRRVLLWNLNAVGEPAPDHQHVRNELLELDAGPPDGSLVRKRQRRLARIAERDGCSCVWCGEQLQLNSICTTYEHLIPKSLGGTKRLENMLLACDECNCARRSFSPAEAVQRFQQTGQQPAVGVIVAALRRLESVPSMSEYAHDQLDLLVAHQVARSGAVPLAA